VCVTWTPSVAATVQRFGGFVAKYMRWSSHLLRLPAGTRDDAERRTRVEWKIIPLSRWTKSFKNFFKSFTQLALRLGLIRGLTSLIRKLDRIGILPGPNPDLHCGYDARADFLGLNGYHAASFSLPPFANAGPVIVKPQTTSGKKERKAAFKRGYSILFSEDPQEVRPSPLPERLPQPEVREKRPASICQVWKSFCRSSSSRRCALGLR
jgi:hypothetical protein